MGQSKWYRHRKAHLLVEIYFAYQFFTFYEFWFLDICVPDSASVPQFDGSSVGKHECIF